MTQTVLILGASGKIGLHAATAFWHAGWKVRLFDRKRDDMVAAAQGVDVIVNGLNPPHYHNWAELIPAITDQVIAAAKASGAMVIIPGNIYTFGNQPGILSAATSQQPNTRKGRIRVDMEAAYRAAGVPTLILRAGNFIDPEGNGDLMSLVVMKAAAKGKLTSLGPDKCAAGLCLCARLGSGRRDVGGTPGRPAALCRCSVPRARFYHDRTTGNGGNCHRAGLQDQPLPLVGDDAFVPGVGAGPRNGRDALPLRDGPPDRRVPVQQSAAGLSAHPIKRGHAGRISAGQCPPRPTYAARRQDRPRPVGRPCPRPAPARRRLRRSPVARHPAGCS